MLRDLTPDELEMLGHCLRVVPSNAVLTGGSATRLGRGGVLRIIEGEAFRSLWNKVAEAVRDRDDMADRRTTAVAS